MGVCFTSMQTKYLHISLIAKIFREENLQQKKQFTHKPKCRKSKYNRKTTIRREKLILKKSSDYLLPLFKGESAKQILDTIQHSHIKPYTDEEKQNTELKIRELLKEGND